MRLAARPLWTPFGRGVVFALASTSIACLLAPFYGVGSMRAATLFVMLPALGSLALIAAWDGLRRDGLLCRGVVIGTAAGLIAALAYDLFRLPFVFADAWGIASIVPPLNLFKVFPRFGMMILGEPAGSPSSWQAHAIGWAYHFSNGATFGVMYVALLGEAARRAWGWGVLWAVGLELGMLLTPYPAVFGIHVAAAFVVVTLLAHLVFGAVLGLLARRMARLWPTTGS